MLLISQPRTTLLTSHDVYYVKLNKDAYRQIAKIDAKES